MFWSIFFESLGLILVMVAAGQLLDTLLRRRKP
jgi:hypothetical protein